MYGLINRGLQCFVRDTFGWSVWLQVVARAGVGSPSFEAFLEYDRQTSFALVEALAVELSRPQDAVLEDFGTYLVTNPTTEVLRRLLRFGGETFNDFIQSLDELAERVKLALSDVELPEIRLKPDGANRYVVQIAGDLPGYSHVVVGVLRSMADDYGALAFIDHEDQGGESRVTIALADDAFAAGRSFELAPVLNEAS